MAYENSSDQVVARAVDAALAAQANAYAPYSNKQVGAAVIAASGSVFAACNLENSDDSLRVCAERNAIAAAVASGERTFEIVIVVSPDHRFWPPCRSCREVIAEFAPQAQVVMRNSAGALYTASFSRLSALPFEGDGSEPLS